MTKKIAAVITIGLLIACFIIAAAVRATTPAITSGLTVHEWGTFTSIAGADGQAMDWRPLSGSTDLPSFVEHFRSEGFKLGLRGTVRMETPVLYFYSPSEQSVSVKVRFANGVITEWYPHASGVEPAAALYDTALYQERHLDGSIAWDSVTLAPGQTADLPNDQRTSHYYAARQTTSTPLRVRTSGGDQYEKFLFYRGVSAFTVPISAQLDGKTMRVENHGAEAIPNTILFERRGEKLGFRINGPLETEAIFTAPELDGSVDAVARELERILVGQGLFQNEAQAMVQTWRESWFEEGSRLLYIVPREFVNSVLPLSISPAPEQITRVFVGRLELITAETTTTVEKAFAQHDRATLAKYARFLEPILNTMIKNAASPDKAQVFRKDLNVYYNSQSLR